METRRFAFRRIRRLLISSPAVARSIVYGRFRSTFRGRGVEFDSLREYSFEDDARFIDWNVTVRAAKPFMKLFVEDRALPMMLVMDRSSSMDGSGIRASKRTTAAEAFALLAGAASLEGMPLGAVFFGGERELAPLRKGRKHAFALVERALDRGAESWGSDLAGALAAARPRLKRRGIIVVLSDFASTGWAREAAATARSHDLVLVRVRSPYEGSPPDSGIFPAIDPETGSRHYAGFGSRSWRESYVEFWEDVADTWRESLAEAKACGFELSTEDDVAQALVAFFRRRGVRR